MDNHITIQFAPLTLAFNSPSQLIIHQLNKIFSGYACNRSPDFTINVLPSHQLPNPLTQMQQNWVPLMVDGNKFIIGPQVIEGTLNLDKRDVAISIKHDFFNFPIAEVLQGFLQRLYHTICNHLAIERYFIHGCGVIREETGYLFIGPHQSGKTTIGQSSNAIVIHDDQILIGFDNGKLFMNSPPLPARYNLRQHMKTPCTLERIFVIKKAKNFFLKRLNSEAAIASLYREIITPLTLTSVDEAKARVKKSAFCLGIIKAIPLCELYFDKEGKFWDDLIHMQWGGIDEE
jgi:hypothetical protein